MNVGAVAFRIAILRLKRPFDDLFVWFQEPVRARMLHGLIRKGQVPQAAAARRSRTPERAAGNIRGDGCIGMRPLRTMGAFEMSKARCGASV
jgi:hypothetical protein